jgi:hypothetical protein
MNAKRFTPPQNWEDWASWVLGIWLCISPWVLTFDLEPVATRVAVITGVLIIVVELVTLSAFRHWEEWVNVLLGAWLVAAAWLLHIAIRAVWIDFIVVGLLVLALALYEIWRPGGDTAA